jgi:hypothetical protein
MPCKAADERDGDGDAGGRGKEVLYRQAEHLDQVAHRRFAAIALPVGVGDEAHRRVEGRIGADVGHVLRIQWQPQLQALQGIDGEQAERVEQQQRQRILQPAHLFVAPDAARPEYCFLEAADQGA